MVTAVLDRPTLVLNRNWQPVGVATVARSLVKVWNDTARIVDPADYQQYTWADWAEMVAQEDEPFIQTQWMRRSEEHTSELQSRSDLVCRLLLEKKKKIK